VWYDNSWYKGFDTEVSLAAIKVPAVLIHTDYWYNHYGSYYDENGVLMAAMNDKDVAKIKSLLKAWKLSTSIPATLSTLKSQMNSRKYSLTLPQK
jgi:hypothetical protein